MLFLLKYLMPFFIKPFQKAFLLEKTSSPTNKRLFYFTGDLNQGYSFAIKNLKKALTVKEISLKL